MNRSARFPGSGIGYSSTIARLRSIHFPGAAAFFACTVS
jgi:hypothetical protein